MVRLVCSVGGHASKHRALGKSSNGEGCDNTKVIRTSTERKIKVRIIRLGGTGDGSVR